MVLDERTRRNEQPASRRERHAAGQPDRGHGEHGGRARPRALSPKAGGHEPLSDQRPRMTSFHSLSGELVWPRPAQAGSHHPATNGCPECWCGSGLAVGAVHSRAVHTTATSPLLADPKVAKSDRDWSSESSCSSHRRLEGSFSRGAPAPLRRGPVASGVPGNRPTNQGRTTGRRLSASSLPSIRQTLSSVGTQTIWFAGLSHRLAPSVSSCVTTTVSDHRPRNRSSHPVSSRLIRSSLT